MGLNMKKRSSSKTVLFLIDLTLYLLVLSLIFGAYVLVFKVPSKSIQEVKKPTHKKITVEKSVSKTPIVKRVITKTTRTPLVKNIQKPKVKKYSLRVRTTPKNAQVKILNIKAKFYQGIRLKSGRYHVSISKKGYENLHFWIKLKSNTTLKETLLSKDY